MTKLPLHLPRVRLSQSVLWSTYSKRKCEDRCSEFGEPPCFKLGRTTTCKPCRAPTKMPMKEEDK